MHGAAHIPAGILSSQLMLGSLARLPHSPFPRLQKIAMSKAEGFKAAVPFVPLDAVSLTQYFGFILGLASILVALPRTRRLGSMLSGSLSILMWYSQAKMGATDWLPIVNALLAALIFTISKGYWRAINKLHTECGETSVRFREYNLMIKVAGTQLRQNYGRLFLGQQGTWALQLDQGTKLTYSTRESKHHSISDCGQAKLAERIIQHWNLFRHIQVYVI